MAAGGKDPRHSNAIVQSEAAHGGTGLRNPADDLVTRYHREAGRNPPFDFIKFCMAYSAGQDAEKNITGTGIGAFPLFEFERMGLVEDVNRCLQDPSLHHHGLASWKGTEVAAACLLLLDRMLHYFLL